MKVFKRMGWLAVLAAAGLGSAAVAQTRHAKTRPVAEHITLSQAKIEAAKARGVSTAPIRIDEFSDFECPHCQNLYQNTLRPLIDNEVAGGKVYLVHHDFPLTIHPYARQAAYYADAAAVIGRLERAEEALFQHQSEWYATGKMEPFLTAVLSPADWKRVQELAQSPEIHAAVERDFEMGQKLGVDQTPTMFITYKGHRTPVVGDVSYEILHRYLDALLKQ